nr:lrr receptor-like serine/threonine-protein kinase gso1 [Quercus suber]
MGRSLVKWLLWGLIVLVHLHGHRGCFEEERMGLLEIKEEFARSTPNATIRDHLPPSTRVYILPSWVDDHKSECCEWERVTCNSTTGHVTHLSLHNIWEFDDYFNLKDMVWFLNVSLFESFKELRSLDLSYNAIGGWIEHKDLASLRSLKVLNLADNYFNGSLPKYLCGSEKLEELDLSGNLFEGILPSSLYNLTSLQLLDLSRNEFTGNISSLMAGLTSLKYIDLCSNLFERFSFDSLANISRLEFFRLECDSKKLDVETENSGWVPLFQLEFLVLSNCNLNKLSNQVPTFLFHQYSLRVLDLSYNNLKGPFPNWLLVNNTRLEFFSLNNNLFMGPLHLSLPLNSTYAMDVSNNQLSGHLQGNIGNILPKIRILHLFKNDFEGFLPFSIGNMSLLGILNLSFNNFSGEVPKESLAGCFLLQILDLSNNKFSGPLLSSTFNFTELKVLKINDNQFSGALSPICSLMSYFDVSNNKLSDKIPTSICNETNLDTLFLRNNFFRGQIPCETIQIQRLDLSQNSLSGSLPSWSSERLEAVHLGQNNFSGSIPKAFLNISKLSILDISDNRLSGRIPSAIGELSALLVLLLRGNRLRGIIPTQFCQLIDIQLMDLSNNFLSGTIPHCFGRVFSKDLISFEIDLVHISTMPYEYRIFQKVINVPVLGIFYDGLGNKVGLCYYEYYPQDEFNFITKFRRSSYKVPIFYYMFGLDLSCNNLTGGIPIELGQLSGILSLNLSHNQLTGPIPETLSNMTELESLDLSYNNLSGEIPPQLIALHFLEVFCVAHNNLSGGTLDMKAQFGTFTASSYEGNQFLCGLPLEKNCTIKDDSPPTPTKSLDVNDGKWYKVDQTVFFTTFSVTYIMFCLGVITVLYINPHWRLRCFNLVEDCMYSCYFFVVISLRKLAIRLYN